MSFTVNTLIELTEQGVLVPRIYSSFIILTGPEPWMDFHLQRVFIPVYWRMTLTLRGQGYRGLLGGCSQHQLWQLVCVAKRVAKSNEIKESSRVNTSINQLLSDKLLAYYRQRHAELDKIIREHDSQADIK